MTTKFAMVLLSGGLDSTTVATHAVHEGYTVRAVAVRYGQSHQCEVESAGRVAKRLGIPLQVVDVPSYGAVAAYSALTNTAEHDVPSNRPPSDMGEGIPITYVPLRNTFFVTLAAAALESWMLERVEQDSVQPEELDPVVMVGANAIDYSGYPDCRPEFYDALAEVLRLGSKLGTAYGVPLRIEAPIIRLSKREIVEYALKLGAPLDLTWSCYAGGAVPCGVCDSCLLRAAGFAAAGVADPAFPAR